MRKITRTRAFAAALVATFCLAGSAFAADARPAAAAKPLTDANIAAIVLAANTIDINNAHVALKRSANASVKDFAKMMVTDHTSVNGKAKALATKLKLKPVENADSRGLVKAMNAKRAAFARLKGGAFDKAYMDNEVSYHQAVIDMLDQKLIPGASNAELKDLLTSVHPAFEAHLSHAKEVRAALKD